MNRKLLNIIGLGATILGAGATVISNMVSDEKMNVEIDERIDQKLAELNMENNDEES